MLNCGTTPEQYFCRPSRQWTISSYYGASDTERCGDHYLGRVQVFAGEGMLRIRQADAPDKFYAHGRVEEGTLTAILSQTDERFFFVFWDGEGSIGGRYGLVHRFDGDVSKDTRAAWDARVTPALLDEFRSWLEREVLAAPDTPQIVRDTISFAISKEFNLRSGSGE